MEGIEMSDISIYLGYISLTKALFDVMEKAYSWAKKVSDNSKNIREQQDSRILATSGVLVASLRTIDNMFRNILSELRLFESDWAPERRQQIITRIREFAEQEHVIRIIRESVSQLEVFESEADDLSESVNTLLSCGKGILNAFEDSTVTPFPSVIDFRNYLQSIKNAQNELDVKFVIKDTDRYIDSFDRSILREADETFGKLKGLILKRNPNMPDPGWSVSLKLVTG
jgi:hypothetical protein